MYYFLNTVKVIGNPPLAGFVLLFTVWQYCGRSTTLTRSNAHLLGICRFGSAQRPGVLHGAQILFDPTFESDPAR